VAAQTQLGLTATPGRRYSFAAKDPAAGAGPHTGGPFTELAPTATPGQRHSFVAKTPAAGAGAHTGLFTTLHLYGGPGRRHSFTAKTVVVPVVPVVEAEEDTRPRGKKVLGRPQGHWDDQDITEIFGALAQLEILCDN
jgi:hypothetical protein